MLESVDFAPGFEHAIPDKSEFHDRFIAGVNIVDARSYNG